MDKGGGMPKMAESVETKKDIEVLPIRNVDTFKKYRGEIARLKKNALGTPEFTDDEANDDGPEHEPDETELSRLDSAYLPKSEKGELFVVIKHDRVTAVVAVRKNAGPQMSADIEEFWMAKGKQKGVVKNALLQVREELRKEGIRKVNVGVEEAAESRFHSLQREMPELKYFRVKQNEHAPVMPKVEPKMEMPEADNDNDVSLEKAA